jgi:hypothetical protein
MSTACGDQETRESERAQTRPAAPIPGYLRAHLLVTEEELDDAKGRLAHFAESEGYTLGTVYVERVDLAPAAFGALIQSLEHDGPEAIVIPNVLHLAGLGIPPQLIHYLQSVTGVQVLVAHPS